MITSRILQGPPQHISRRAVGLAGLIGAGTVCTCWPLMLVWMIIGLTLSMPEGMGGRALPYPVAVGVSGTVVGAGAVGILFVAVRLLRSARVLRPFTVVVVGLLLSMCLFSVLGRATESLVTTQDAVLGPVLVPLTGAAGFALASRVARYRGAALGIVLVSAALTAATWAL